VGELLERHLFRHFQASLLALVAFIGTHFHVLIPSELLALFPASSTRFCTRLTNESGKRPTPGNDLSGGGANARTVLTSHERC